MNRNLSRNVMLLLTVLIITLSLNVIPMEISASGKINVSKASGTYEVTASSLNIRSGNGTDYSKVGTLKKNKQITVNGKTSNGWYRFSYNGTNRYVSGKYLKKVTVKKVTDTPLVNASGKYTVTSSTLNVRTGNGANFKKVGSLKKGTEITVNGKRGTWYRFSYKGTNRYVSGKYLKKKRLTVLRVRM